MITNKTVGKIFHGAAAQEYLGIRQLVVRNCFHFHGLFLFGFIYVLLLLFITIYSYQCDCCGGGDDVDDYGYHYLFFITSIFKQFLSQPLNFLTLTFPVLLPPSHCDTSA